jgi:hypothetical protein
LFAHASQWLLRAQGYYIQATPPHLSHLSKVESTLATLSIPFKMPVFIAF